jgi:hypothetical protein
MKFEFAVKIHWEVARAFAAMNHTLVVLVTHGVDLALGKLDRAVVVSHFASLVSTKKIRNFWFYLKMVRAHGHEMYYWY